jgi:hypothetical protein
MRVGWFIVAATAGFSAGAPQSRASNQLDKAAEQVTGLFMQSCMQFAGDNDGLRQWARKIALPELPAAAVRDRFLYGLPGIVFDASNKDGKFVLVSEDGGSCSVIAQIASGTSTIRDLEKDMNDARITYRMTTAKRDSEERLLQHREYTASQGDRGWLLLVSTVEGEAGGQVMLTANRN